MKVETFAASSSASPFLSPGDWCCWSLLFLFFYVFSLQLHSLGLAKIYIDCSNPLSFPIEFIAAKAKQSALSYGIEALHWKSLLFYWRLDSYRNLQLWPVGMISFRSFSVNLFVLFLTLRLLLCQTSSRWAHPQLDLRGWPRFYRSDLPV